MSLTAELLDRATGLLESGNKGDRKRKLPNLTALMTKAAGTPCGLNGNCNSCDETLNSTGVGSGSRAFGELGLDGVFRRNLPGGTHNRVRRESWGGTNYIFAG